jgi:hypothetical protein
LIVLSNEKQIIKVETWEDITSRPGFSGHLDPSSHTLHAIIGRYAFPAKVPCGLSNCHTPHGKGYIVVTKDGQETNIGKDCGKSYFGVDFETLSAKFDRDLTEKENREKLWSFVFRMDELSEQIRNLRGGERGGDWVYKTSRQLLNAGREVPPAVVRRIAQMIKTRQTTLTTEREPTEREYHELDMQAGKRVPRPQFVVVPVADVAALDALFAENDIKELLVIELEERIKELDALNVDSLSYEALRKWSRWISGVEAVLERAAASIEKGRRLLTGANLAPFGDAVGLNTEDLLQFQKYLKQLPQQ